MKKILTIISIFFSLVSFGQNQPNHVRIPYIFDKSVTLKDTLHFSDGSKQWKAATTTNLSGIRDTIVQIEDTLSAHNTEIQTNKTNISNKLNVSDTTGKWLSTTHPVPIANGGTNGTSIPTAGAVSYGTGSAYAFTSAGTSGQVLTSNGSSAPTWANVVSLTYLVQGGGTNKIHEMASKAHAAHGYQTVFIEGDAPYTENYSFIYDSINYVALGTVYITHSESSDSAMFNFSGNKSDFNLRGNFVITSNKSVLYNVSSSNKINVNIDGLIATTTGAGKHTIYFESPKFNIVYLNVTSTSTGGNALKVVSLNSDVISFTANGTYKSTFSNGVYLSTFSSNYIQGFTMNAVVITTAVGSAAFYISAWDAFPSNFFINVPCFGGKAIDCEGTFVECYFSGTINGDVTINTNPFITFDGQIAFGTITLTNTNIANSNLQPTVRFNSSIYECGITNVSNRPTYVEFNGNITASGGVINSSLLNMSNANGRIIFNGQVNYGGYNSTYKISISAGTAIFNNLVLLGSNHSNDASINISGGNVILNNLVESVILSGSKSFPLITISGGSLNLNPNCILNNTLTNVISYPNADGILVTGNCTIGFNSCKIITTDAASLSVNNASSTVIVKHYNNWYVNHGRGGAGTYTDQIGAGGSEIIDANVTPY